MERSVIRIRRAAPHPSQMQIAIAVQSVGMTRAWQGVELTLICIEYYQDAFAIPCRLRLTTASGSDEMPTIVIPWIHARVSDAARTAYAVMYEPFLGSHVDYRGILRITPMLPSIGAPFQVIINGVTWCADNGRCWRDTRCEVSGLVYEIRGA